MKTTAEQEVKDHRMVKSEDIWVGDIQLSNILEKKHWKKEFFSFLFCGRLFQYREGGTAMKFEKGLTLVSKEPWF